MLYLLIGSFLSATGLTAACSMCRYRARPRTLTSEPTPAQLIRLHPSGRAGLCALVRSRHGFRNRVLNIAPALREVGVEELPETYLYVVTKHKYLPQAFY